MSRLEVGWMRTAKVAGLLVVSGALGCQAQPDHQGGEADPEDVPDSIEAVTAAPPEEATPLLDRRAEPATQGMDSVRLAEAEAEAASLSRLHSMVVARHGDVVLERRFRGPSLDDAVNVKSVSKSLLSAIVGGAVEEGYLDGVRDPIEPHFPEVLPVVTGDEAASEWAALDAEGEGGEAVEVSRSSDPRAAITMEDLLAMSSGLESTSFGNRYGRWVSSPDWVRYALEEPMTFEPGSRMVYSTGNSHLASAVLTRAAERSTHALAQEVLAEPLGIRLPPWPQDPQGIYFGGNDMLISPRDLLRFGEMYRAGGEYDGDRVLPREWIEDSWDVRVRSPRNGDGYALGWWARDAGAYEVRFAWGYGGQYLFIVPELELTVVFTSDPYGPRERGHNQTLHRILDELLVPAAEAGAGQ